MKRIFYSFVISVLIMGFVNIVPVRASTIQGDLYVIGENMNTNIEWLQNSSLDVLGICREDDAFLIIEYVDNNLGIEKNFEVYKNNTKYYMSLSNLKDLYSVILKNNSVLLDKQIEDIIKNLDLFSKYICIFDETDIESINIFLQFLKISESGVDYEVNKKDLNSLINIDLKGSDFSNLSLCCRYLKCKEKNNNILQIDEENMEYLKNIYTQIKQNEYKKNPVISMEIDMQSRDGYLYVDANKYVGTEVLRLRGNLKDTIVYFNVNDLFIVLGKEYYIDNDTLKVDEESLEYIIEDNELLISVKELEKLGFILEQTEFYTFLF